jgi:hypothetical protein
MAHVCQSRLSRKWWKYPLSILAILRLFQAQI